VFISREKTPYLHLNSVASDLAHGSVRRRCNQTAAVKTVNSE
jgi:hypothetical protein